MRTGLAIAIALTTLAAGCGGGSATDATNGKQIFLDAGCGGCHTLSAAGSSGAAGPNLDDAKPDVATVKDRVTNGGGGMPSFEGRLTDEQIGAVATFVSGAAGG